MSIIPPERTLSDDDISVMRSVVRLFEAVQGEDWAAGMHALYSCDPIPTIMSLVGLVVTITEGQGQDIQTLVDGLRAQIPGGAE